MLRRVTLVRIDVAEERSASIIKVMKICELVISLAVTTNGSTPSPVCTQNTTFLMLGSASNFRPHFGPIGRSNLFLQRQSDG
jgi:hypothetical protein